MSDRGRPDAPSPETGVKVGLLVASAVVPGTFAPSLSARSPVDQGIVTGLSTGLHYLFTVGTQDAIQAAAAELVAAGSGRRLGTDVARRQRRLTLLADLAAIPLGFAVQKALPERPGEAMLRGLARQVGWRFTVTGVGGSLLIGSEAALQGLDNRLGGRRRFAAIPVAVPVGLAVAYVLERRRREDDDDAGTAADRACAGGSATARHRGRRGRWLGSRGVRRALARDRGRPAALRGAAGRPAAVEADRARGIPRGARRCRLHALGTGHGQDRGWCLGQRAGRRARRGHPLDRDHRQRRRRKPGAVGDPGPRRAPARADVRAAGALDRPSGRSSGPVHRDRDARAGQSHTRPRLRQPGQRSDRPRASGPGHGRDGARRRVRPVVDHAHLAHGHGLRQLRRGGRGLVPHEGRRRHGHDAVLQATVAAVTRQGEGRPRPEPAPVASDRRTPAGTARPATAGRGLRREPRCPHQPGRVPALGDSRSPGARHRPSALDRHAVPQWLDARGHRAGNGWTSKGTRSPSSTTSSSSRHSARSGEPSFATCSSATTTTASRGSGPTC